MFRAFVLLLTFGCTVGSAQADVLLGTFQMGMGGGTSSVPVSSIKSIAFEFGYSIELQGAKCAVHRVGCEGIPITDAFRGAGFTFRTSNSQWFPEIAARLTNGTSENLAFVNRLFDANGVMKFAGGNGGGSESQAFGTPTDLIGYTISAITLELQTFKISDNTLCGGQPGGVCYQSDLIWRIYGFPNVTPARPTSWGRVKSQYR